MLLGNIEATLLLLFSIIIIIIIILFCSNLNVLVSGRKVFKMLYNFLVREHAFSKRIYHLSQTI